MLLFRKVRANEAQSDDPISATSVRSSSVDVFQVLCVTESHLNDI